MRLFVLALTLLCSLVSPFLLPPSIPSHFSKLHLPKLHSSAPSSIPSLVNLDTDPSSYPRHRAVKNWLTFSDLHVSTSSLNTTLTVLSHMITLSNADPTNGLLFLGDFFHHRGALDVPTLHHLLPLLSTLKSPIILLPGNHDQYTYDPSIHSLTPLSYAFSSFPSQCLLMTLPTVFNNAFFIPHLRNTSHYAPLLSLAHAHTPQLAALFLHADVAGAFMNDNLASTSDLHPAIFPPETPTYSGHFHKPHALTTPTHNITYIGSPYQTSQSEAGQEKRYLNLTSHYAPQSSHPLPLPVPRYHITTSTDLPGLIPQLSPGDTLLITYTLPLNTTQPQPDLLATIQTLRKTGVKVRLKRISIPPASKPPPTPKSPPPQRTPSTLLAHYLSPLLLPPSLKTAAQTLLTTTPSPPPPIPTTATFHTITLTNFLSYRHPQIYPLTARGLTLLKGSPIHPSNGSGKTSLLISLLWGLTGGFEPRPNERGKASVVNDAGGGRGSVTVEGRVNGVEVVVERWVGKRGQGIRVWKDGVEVTLQTATMTQGLINSMFGGDLNEILSRCVFGCGQYGTNGLLEGGDVGFKEDLGRVVCTEVWRECLGTARGRKNKARKEVERGGAVLESKSGDLAEGERRLEGFAKVLERVVTGDGGGDIATVDTLETLLADLDDKMDENDDAVTAALESARRRRIELEVEISNVKKAEEDGVCPTCGRGTENHSPVAHVGELKTSLSAVCGTVSGLERNQRDAKSVKRNERSAVARRLEDARRREGEVARAERDVEVWKEQVEKGAAVVVTLTAELAEKTAQLEEATQLEVIFGSKGIQGYVLEDLVSELQDISDKYIQMLGAGELRLRLDVADGERVGKRAEVFRESEEGVGEWLPRPLSQLSGGQWRRLSLGLMFGYRELAERRGRWAGNLFVLDEPLTHLDGEGKRAVGEVLKTMLEDDNGLDSIVLILQDAAAEELEQDFDSTDIVVRDEEGSRVGVGS